MADADGVAVSIDARLTGPRVRDLRRVDLDEVLGKVEAGLGTDLDRDALLRKRRSVGARSGRGTWVRIEARPWAKIAAHGQPGDGLEAAQPLTEVARPCWHRGLSWSDRDEQLSWRADEIELVSEPTVRAGGRIPEDLELPESWWTTLNRSLSNLADAYTTRVATPDTDAISQGLVDTTISAVFGPEVDTTVTDHRWVPAHADLAWANLTHPQCCLLDWEDWGNAPRGLDAAVLWIGSLGITQLAARVRHERRADLDSRSGRVMTLFACAKVLADDSTPARLVELTRAVSVPLAQELTR